MIGADTDRRKRANCCPNSDTKLPQFCQQDRAKGDEDDAPEEPVRVKEPERPKHDWRAEAATQEKDDEDSDEVGAAKTRFRFHLQCHFRSLLYSVFL